MAKSLKKFFNNLGGLNLRAPELLKGDTYATDLRNIEFSENFSLTKRRGYQTLLKGFGKCGSVTYNETDISTGTQTEERLLIDENLRKVVENTITISYSGSASPQHAVQLSPEDNNFYLYLYEDGGISQAINLGSGKEGSPVTIEDALAAITGDFSGVASGVETGPAAFIRTAPRKSSGQNSATADGIQSSGASSIDINENIEADTPRRGTIVINGDTYVYDSYSGKTFEITTTLSTNYADASDISYTSGNALVYTTVATIPSPKTDPLQALLDDVDTISFEPASTVQIHNCVYLTSSQTGLWKYDGTNLIKAGLPVPVISSPDVDAAASDKWIYIAEFEYTDAKDNTVFSTRSNELTVDSTDTTISISVAAISDADGYDADNVTVNLYRTTNNGTTFYLVNSKTASSGVATVFNQADTPSDVSTTVEDTTLATKTTYVIPFRDATPPPSCRYIDVWRNQIVMTGDPNQVQTVYLANTEDLEGFDFRNSFETSSRLGGSNSGLKSLDNFLYIFRAHSVSVATGYPDDLTLVVDTMSDEGIGAVSHQSLVEADNQIFFVSRRGIFSVSGNKMSDKADIILPVFNNVDFRENRVQSFHFLYENKVAFLLPVYGETGVDMSENYILVFDMISKSWAIWDNMDFTCNMNLDQFDSWFVSNDNGSYYYNERLNTETELDYADHESAVSAYYKTHWETGGEPSIPKKYTKLKVFALDTDFRNFGTTDFALTVETNNNFGLDPIVSFDMQFGGDTEGWGEGPWGGFPWGDSVLLTVVSRLQSRRLQALRLVFRNNVTHENILISGFELELTSPYVPRLRGTR